MCSFQLREYSPREKEDKVQRFLKGMTEDGMKKRAEIATASSKVVII